MAKIYCIMAYPNSFPIYADNAEEALAKYRKKHPSDKREYTFTGAYNAWVIAEPKKDSFTIIARPAININDFNNI